MSHTARMMFSSVQMLIIHFHSPFLSLKFVEKRLVWKGGKAIRSDDEDRQ